MGDGTIDYYSRMEAAKQAAYANSPEAQQQAHAMEMDRLDRANAVKAYNDLFAFSTGAGGSGESGKIGISGAEDRLLKLLDDPDSIKQTGSYKFRVGQGQEALQRSLGAKGLLNSGNRLTELTKYGQDMGSQEYENQFGRLSDLLGTYKLSQDRQLGSLAGSLSGGALGRGGTGDIWQAYTNPRTALAGKKTSVAYGPGTVSASW